MAADLQPGTSHAGSPGGMGGPMGQGAAGGMMGPGGMGSMMGPGGMDGMMEQMGAPKPKQLYPSLMALPDLSMERRDVMQRQAHERMQSGAALMREGLEALSRSAPSDDYVAMQHGSDLAREGLARFESGLAAHRALAEGKAPRDVALRWFKREMNLLPPVWSAQPDGPFGLSWFHFLSMLVLTAFGVAMIVLYFFKMRRAAALLANLAAHPSVPTTAEAPTVEPAPASGAPPVESGAAPATVAADSGSERPASEADCCDDGQERCPSESPLADAQVSGGLLPAIERKLCRLRVARIQDETADVKTFRFVSCHGGGVPFSYLPGQFLTLTLPVGENPIRRSYTISSSPTQGYYCEITVKREEHGVGSRFLHDVVKLGDTVEVKAPSGRFCFTGEESNSVVLIAGGVGITPMMSITRALTDMAWPGEIFFVVACRDPEHFIFESEVQQLAARYVNLHLFAAMSRIDQDQGAYRSGRLSKAMLAEWVPGIEARRVHLCGAPPMMHGVKQMLGDLGVPESQIHTESFGSAQKPMVRAAELARSPSPAPRGESVGRVTFVASDKSTDLLPDETVLEAAERVDVDIAYSCRVGSCGECKVKLVSGSVSMEVEDGLDPGDADNGLILACQAKASGPVSIQA